MSIIIILHPYRHPSWAHNWQCQMPPSLHTAACTFSPLTHLTHPLLLLFCSGAPLAGCQAFRLNISGAPVVVS